ncbi:MAG: 3-isopropylmalate dehydrogenase [Aquificaceae bacterium]
MAFKVAILEGDGIGPEVVNCAKRVLETISRLYSIDIDFKYGLIGGAAIDALSKPLPEETLNLCKEADAILLGAVGGPKWDELPTALRPEAGLLSLRKELDLYANLRPVKVFKELSESSPIKNVDGVDLIIVRELTGDAYFAEPRGIFNENQERVGINTMRYTESQIRRVAKFAFELAKSRRKKLTSVDKANVLEVGALWRKVVNEVSEEYPDVELEHLYVDNCAIQLIKRPKSFDVLLTGNIFGDILSDEAGALSASLGMLPSASIGNSHALYEPVHGSAPDIAGKGIANPIATVLSVSMMLKYSFKNQEAGKLVEDAVEKALSMGFFTPDICPEGKTPSKTDDICNAIIKVLEGRE